MFREEPSRRPWDGQHRVVQLAGSNRGYLIFGNSFSSFDDCISVPLIFVICCIFKEIIFLNIFYISGSLLFLCSFIQSLSPLNPPMLNPVILPSKSRPHALSSHSPPPPPHILPPCFIQPFFPLNSAPMLYPVILPSKSRPLALSSHSPL